MYHPDLRGDEVCPVLRTRNLMALVKPGSENQGCLPGGHAHHAMGWLPTTTQQEQAQVIRESRGEVGTTAWPGCTAAEAAGGCSEVRVCVQGAWIWNSN